MISAPVKEGQRILIIDAVRGVALLGILMMNIPYFANPSQYENLNTFNQYSGINYYTWWIVNFFFEGTMRAIFSLLFGAGCLLLLNRLEGNRSTAGNAADIYYRRVLWLLVFGLVNAFIFQWPGDILYIYALCGLFLFPFRNLKVRPLLLLSLLFFICYTIRGTYDLYVEHAMRANGEKALMLEQQKKLLTDDQKADKTAWTAYLEKQKPENLRKAADKKIKDLHGSYFQTFALLAVNTGRGQSVYFYQYNFFDSMCLLFLGMALFKLGVLTGKRSKKFYWLLLFGSYIPGLALSYFEHRNLISVRFDNTQLFSRMPVELYQFRRTFLALGHLSVLMLLYKYGIAKRFLNALAKVGQMAFTNYLMQSIICVTIFYGFGFGLYGNLQMYQEYYVVLCIWIFQIIFSQVWMHYFNFGPFEWIWRSLTYWKKQPMKKTVTTAEREEDPDGEGNIVPAM